MDSGRSTESWWCGNRMRNVTDIRIWVLTLALLPQSAAALADSLSSQDREEINRLRSAQGHSAEDVNQLLEQVAKAGDKGLPTEPLANKVKEGLAKGVEPKRIDPVLRQLVTHFESAQEILQESANRGMVDPTQGNRQRALESLADAFSRGATADEVRELARSGQRQGQKLNQELFASGAKSLAVMKEAKIPSKDGAALVAEGMRQGYRPAELADLARELKRRGQDIRDGRLSTQALRDQIARGDRGDRLFREDRGGSGGGGDRGGRGDSGRDRMDRPDRSGHGDRPERADRPEKVDRPERPDRPDRSGSGRDR